MTRPKIQNIGFLLVENFSMIAFAAAIEPLRAANRLSNQELYNWQTISNEGNSVQCSNGLEIKVDAALNKFIEIDLLLVCGGINIKNEENNKIFANLRRLARSGVRVGAICTATYLLAKSGLMSNRRCTIHWENTLSMKEEFPELEITNNLFEIDKDRFTCAGGTSALDMMLHIIKLDHGNNPSSLISDQLIHVRIRDAEDHQRMDLRSRLGVSNSKLILTVKNMENNIEEPLSQKDLAAKANISLRQLERLFKKYLYCTPAKYYLNLRLNNAKQLLNQTSMSVLSVALACGFVSASHFSKCFKDFFGKAPSTERLKIIS